jgi:WD40 repeat protein
VTGARRSPARAVLPGLGGVPAFGPGGDVLAAGLPTTLWSIENTAAPRQLSKVSTFNVGGQAVAFSPDGHRLASGNPAVLWDTTEPRTPRPVVPESARSDGANTVVFSPVAPVLVTGGPTTEGIQLWDVRDDRPTAVGTLPGAGGALGAQAAAFSPDGSLLATVGSAEGQIWNVADPTRPAVVSQLDGASPRSNSIAFAPDGKAVYVGGNDGSISVWEVTSPAAPTLVDTLHRHVGGVWGLATQPGGSLLASASEDGTLVLWSIADGTRPVEVAVLQPGGERLDYSYAAFSPGGGKLAVSDEAGTLLWDVDAAAILRRICAETSPLSAAQWNLYLPGQTYDPPCA